MTILSAVVWSVAILFLLISVQATSGITNNGLKWGFGPRDSSKDDTVFQARSKRTVANHIESMMLFVPLALVAHMIGATGDMLAKGTLLYVIARGIYPMTYWTGIPVVRTLVWTAGVLGTFMVFIAVVSAV
jgi:uncharacterized MAPEG superfamily protein